MAEGKPDFSLGDDEDQQALRFVHAIPGAALCTIVGIEGSFSRRLGAQLAVGTDHGAAGSLSDGCLERELASQARMAMDARVLRFGRGEPFIDFRLPCGSAIDILIDPAPDRAAIADVVERLDRREPAQLALPTQTLEQRAYVPPLRLAICGAGPEAEWLRDLATGFGVSCVAVGPDNGLYLDHAPDWIRPDAWTAIALMFHDHEWERAILEWALESPAFYIGAIGGRRARENRHDLLISRGVSEAQIARVRSPIGLIEHTRDARTLALSVLADIVARYEEARG